MILPAVRQPVNRKVVLAHNEAVADLRVLAPAGPRNVGLGQYSPDNVRNANQAGNKSSKLQNPPNCWAFASASALSDLPAPATGTAPDTVAPVAHWARGRFEAAANGFAATITA